MVKIGAMYMGGQFTPGTFGRAVEAAGFDSLWAGDHVLHYVDGLTTLGCFAGCTQSIQLGTSVIVAPFRSPAVLAKALMTASWIADRQIVAGIGPGGDVLKEFQVTGANFKTRGAYTDEALQVMQLLWSGQKVSFNGRFSRFDDVQMHRAGNRSDHESVRTPEIWIGGRSEAALRRTVRFGSGYLPYLISPEQLKERVSRLRELADEAGRAFDEITVACTTFVVPAASHAHAIELGRNAVGFNAVTAENMERYYVLGSVAECVDRIHEYIEAGASHVVLGCHGGQDRQLECFLESAAGILPALRQPATPAQSIEVIG